MFGAASSSSSSHSGTWRRCGAPLWLLISSLVFLLSHEHALASSSQQQQQQQQQQKYSDYWVLTLNEQGGLAQAAKLARDNDFTLLRQIGNTNNYVCKSNHHRVRRSSSSSSGSESLTDSIRKSEETITAQPIVESFKREVVLVRTKRDFVEPPPLPPSSSSQQQHAAQVVKRDADVGGQDQFWPEMWYLNRHLTSDLPDMNVTGAWELGVSGRGVSVTFLDDGLEWNHPDIQQNYDPKASADINDGDNDPMPRYEETNENKHGTRCAGEVAAVANNSVCSVGVAFNSGIGGIRMLDGDVTDSVEASSLSYNSNHIAIYSASWGPDDNGEVVDGPGALAKKAFEDGALMGRNGLGSIFVWASGNGGRFNDSCACDGYANSIYTLSISSTSENSEKPWYLEECTSTLATTYSSGDERHGEHEIITTDIHHQCTKKHTGTSAAAPLAAGIIALALEANPKLTWRDVMFLVVLSSQAKSIKSNNYIVNKRGLKVSSRYGFGLMNAGRMVEMARTWTNVPSLQSCTTFNANQYSVKTIQLTNSIEAILTTDACLDTVNEVAYIEQVEIIATIKAPVRGMLEIHLTSPMGTKSLILPRRSRDNSGDGFKRWSFMTVQLWGENPRGNWVLTVSSSDGSTVSVEDYALIIHGTKTRPVDYDRYVDSDHSNCNPECLPVGASCGPTAYDCSHCAHYTLTLDSNKIKCVSLCPRGYYADETDGKKCIKCAPTCRECNGPLSSNCISCLNGTIHKQDTNECLATCPINDSYFINSDNACERCDKECQTCHVDSSICLTCKTSNSNGQQFALRHNKCVLQNMKVLDTSCESGMFYDVETSQCRTCDISCAECTSLSANSCLKCPSRRKYLTHGTCGDSCATGYYYNQTAERCFRCHSNCIECSENSGQCLSCERGYELSNGKCVRLLTDDNCPDQNCFECVQSNRDRCVACKYELSLTEEGKCASTVASGHFKMKITTNRGTFYRTEKCADNCTDCRERNMCTKCADGFILSNGKCLSKCEPKFYPTVFGTCMPCQAPCGECKHASACLTCVPGKYLLNDKCFDKCPVGFYSTESSVCLECHPSCEKCNGGKKEECLECGSGFKPVVVGKKFTCESTCPDGTFYDQASGDCSLCNSTSCLTCIKGPSQCTRCSTPLVLDTLNWSCKPCCGRSVHGKLKASMCCNCPTVYDGTCLVDVKEELATISRGWLSTISWSRLETFLGVVFILVAVVLVALSLRYFVTLHKSYKKFVSVEYSRLNEQINE